MERPTRFEDFRYVGDKRNQVVHDLDACTAPEIIEELMEAETYLAFGPDTLFGDHVGLHHYYAKQLSIGSINRGVQYEEVEYVDGVENPGEAFPNIVRWMVKHDYSDGDIAKAIGGNVMRVLEEAWFR